ncbi:MAG: LuxR C-terminal-related transcriptional regulator [Acidimicrobiales bacterium]
MAALMEQAWHHRLVTVITPAGYGKSTMISQFLESMPTDRQAWLSLDERDADPVRLGHHLLAALDRARPGMGDALAGSLEGCAVALGDRFIDLLLEQLWMSPEPLVVVVEDIDRVDASVVEELSRLVLEAPPHVHFVVTARVDPAMPTARLRSRGDLFEIRADDLRFTNAEARAVVAGVAGVEIGVDAADHLLDRTEGWPVAVYLAALSLVSTGTGLADPGLAIGATDRNIVDFMSAEILAFESDDVRTFLQDTSVLELLDPDMCDFVTRRSDSAAILADLHHRGVFLTKVADGAGQYRCYRLLRELLRQDLVSLDPERPRTLRRRAASRALERGDVEYAAGYLIAAEDWSGLAELIRSEGRGLWEQGRARTLVSWMQTMPRRAVFARPWLALGLAAMHLSVGSPEAAAAVLVDLERIRDLTVEEQLVADVGHCMIVLSRNPSAAMSDRAEAALAAIDHVDEARLPDVFGATSLADVRSTLDWATAQARLLRCDGTAAPFARRGVDGAVSTPVALQVHRHATTALVEALLHNASSATSHADRALELAGRHLSESHPSTPMAHVARVIAARSQNHLDHAAERADAALELAMRWDRSPMTALILAERALVSVADGEPASAFGWLRRLERLPPTDRAPLVESRARAAELRAQFACGDAVAGWEVVDRAQDVGWDLAYAAVVASLDCDEVERAAKYLADWPAGAAPFGTLERDISNALVAHRRGDTAGACVLLEEVLRRTARQGTSRVYLDSGVVGLELLEDLARRRAPTAHLDDVVRACRRSVRRPQPLIDRLSPRELEVLEYLPTRLSNAEIATALFVSTNTVKTHVKHIYQKLGATDRDDAVRKAHELGLL